MFCREQLVQLTTVYDRITELDAEVLAISVDDLSGASDVVETLGLPFPVLYDPSKEVPQTYMVYDLLKDGLATPSTFIVDREGVIRWKYVGRLKGDRPNTSEILAELARVQG